MPEDVNDPSVPVEECLRGVRGSISGYCHLLGHDNNPNCVRPDGIVKDDQNVRWIPAKRKVKPKCLVELLLTHSLDKSAVELLHVGARSDFAEEVPTHDIFSFQVRQPLLGRVVLQDRA
jgi:hypothetical protein